MALIVGEPRVLARVGATLGEGPVWDATHKALWFVDIKAAAVFRLDVGSGAVERWPAPTEIGWALPASDGRLLCGLADGLRHFDPATGAFGAPQPVAGEPTGNRQNDATCDTAGRVWFGTMDNSEDAATGRFFRLDHRGLQAAGPPSMAITNGPAVSPDGGTIYFTDTLARRIWRASLDPDGVVGPLQQFVEIEAEAGYPDGPTCDAAGNLWTGLFGGWGLHCYSPDGTLLAKVPLPVANVTKLAFGGEGLTTAFVTTARKGLDAAALAAQPHAGDIFAFEAAIPGAPIAPVPAALLP